MNVYIVGNSFVRKDSLPVRLIPHLQKKFPTIMFQPVDPNENFIPEEEGIIIDTVEGIRAVTVFGDIDVFMTAKSVSPHDYDLGFHLKLLSKLHKLAPLTIIGVPIGTDDNSVLTETIPVLEKLFDKRKHKG
ncbi:MAG TPA: hypothetical protein VMR81_06675 [Patescibacteria group bacterium]|jgi:hypothetical protein|nr:hypothetical protein [Patescibacteria group bacterium]